MTMKRKKVAILLPWLKMGGTNKIAINFMKDLIEYCDVTLILSQNSGELLSDLPQGVKLIIDQMKDFKEIFYSDLRKVKIVSVYKDCVYYATIKRGKDSIDNYKYLVDRHGFISDEIYDCAISYHGQSPERLLNLIYRIHAKKKAAWIHGEVSFSKDKCERLKKYYAQLDHFFFVSNHTKQSFLKIFTIDESKTTVYYNPIDKKEIIEKSNETPEVTFSNDLINILTVGRISSEKGQDMIPQITRNLIDNGNSIKWYLIGEGDNQDKVADLIEQYNVKDNVIMLGVKTNPYCYMKACDVYVQPSYTEGYSTTICEAGILGKAIIGTEPSGGIHDQITDHYDGLIVTADVKGLTEGIQYLIDYPDIRKEYERNILDKNFEGQGEINKFLMYINQ